MDTPKRTRLPAERQAITHKFTIDNHEGYMTVGLYDDGTPGELFITMSKTGSSLSGLIDGFAMVFSIALQYGVPLEVIIVKMAHSKFDPSGQTKNEFIPVASSVMDYIAKWLSVKFLTYEKGKELGLLSNSSIKEESQTKEENDLADTGPPCKNCGMLTIKSGNCYL